MPVSMPMICSTYMRPRAIAATDEACSTVALLESIGQGPWHQSAGDCLLLAQRCEHVRYRTRNQIRAHCGVSREPRKFFSKQRTDFRKRNCGTVRQRGDRPLVPTASLQFSN